VPLPQISDHRINGIVEQVATYVASQRDSYRETASSLNQNHKAAMEQFFPSSVLDLSRTLILNDSRVSNPPFYPALVQMGFDPMLLPDFADMGAITFVDTIVSHGPFTNRTLFHELVHVMQYKRLGLEEFAANYVRGFLTGGSYETIPLERNAYDLDGRFAEAPLRRFSVDHEIQRWIDGGGLV
jgi:hypothetical protein